MIRHGVCQGSVDSGKTGPPGNPSRIGETDRVFAVRRFAPQPPAAIVPPQPTFAQQKPSIAGAKQGGKHPADSQWRGRAGWDLLFVVLLVRRIALFPAALGNRHRLQPRARVRQKMKRRKLLLQSVRFRTRLRERVAEGDAIVRDLKDDVELVSVGRFQMEHFAVGAVLVEPPLRGQDFVAILDRLGTRLADHPQPCREISVFAH